MRWKEGQPRLTANMVLPERSTSYLTPLCLSSFGPILSAGMDLCTMCGHGILADLRLPPAGRERAVALKNGWTCRFDLSPLD